MSLKRPRPQPHYNRLRVLIDRAKLGIMRWVSTALAVLAAATLSCVMLPRYRSLDPSRAVWPVEKLVDAMDPWLLADDFAERVVIEVDWVEGCMPGRLTIAGLRALLVKYGPPGRPVEVLLDDEIPRHAWDEGGAVGSARVDRLVERHADLVDEPYDPEFRTDRRYVFFAPRLGRLNGYSTSWSVIRNEERVSLQGVVVLREPHERYARLWISRDKLERMTLIHEFGHQLGLVANRSHERRPPHERHCTSLKCLMGHPTARVIARNALAGLFNAFMVDYCELCQEDIRRSQAEWRARAARNPQYRAQLVARRQEQRLLASIALRLQRGQHERALAMIEQARQRYGDTWWLRDMEVASLVGLERLEEAKERVIRAAASKRPRMSCSLGRAYVAAGRYEEAIALFDRELLSQTQDYDFEQSAFVLSEALARAGRMEEELSLIDELLRRGHAISFKPPGMSIKRAYLLLHLGRVDEALEASREGLRSREHRHHWLATAAEILDAKGEHVGSQALLREWLRSGETMLERAREPEQRWWSCWSVALAQARLGHSERARETIAQAGPVPDGVLDDARVHLQLPVLAALEEWDEVAGLLRTHSKGLYGIHDPCIRRDLAPMPRGGRFASLFAHCNHR